MKKIFLFVFLMGLALPVLAQPAESPLLTDDEERLVLDLVSGFADGVQVEMQAFLMPPLTLYSVEFPEAEKARIDALKQRAAQAGIRLNVNINPGDWETKLACGKFTDDDYMGTWSHPEGPAPDGCPHEDGTDHKGSIKNRGIIHLTMSKITNPDDILGDKSILRGNWFYDCAYEGGSKTGTSDCKEELQSWSSEEGIIKTGDFGGPSEQGSYSVVVYTGVAIIIGGTTYFFYRWKTKEERETKEENKS